MKEIIFNVDDMVDNSNRFNSITTQNIQNLLFDLISENLIYVKSITTNGFMGSMLQDFGCFSTIKLLSTKAGTSYNIGKFKGVNVIIDSYMLWTDNRFIFDYDKARIRKNKTNFLLGGELIKFEEVFIKVIDTYSILI